MSVKRIRKETVWRRGSPHAGQELLDLCDHRLDVSGPEGVVITRQLDETGTGNSPRELATTFDGEDVSSPVENERRRLNRRQDSGDVCAYGRLNQRACHRRTRTRALEDCPEASLHLAGGTRGD
jgi:hypothetical protein